MLRMQLRLVSKLASGLGPPWRAIKVESRLQGPSCAWWAIKVESSLFPVYGGLKGGRPKGANDDYDDDQGRVITFPSLQGAEGRAPEGRQL